MKIFVQATPRASRNHIEEIDDTHFRVSVTQPPFKGMANEAITELLADYFDVSPSRVRLVSGWTSRQKTFSITT